METSVEESSLASNHLLNNNNNNNNNIKENFDYFDEISTNAAPNNELPSSVVNNSPKKLSKQYPKPPSLIGSQFLSLNTQSIQQSIQQTNIRRGTAASTPSSPHSSPHSSPSSSPRRKLSFDISPLISSLSPSPSLHSSANSLPNHYNNYNNNINNINNNNDNDNDNDDGYNNNNNNDNNNNLGNSGIYISNNNKNDQMNEMINDKIENKMTKITITPFIDQSGEGDFDHIVNLDNNNENYNNNDNDNNNEERRRRKKEEKEEMIIENNEIEEEREEVRREGGGEEASELAVRQAASLVIDAETSRFDMHKIDETSLKVYSFYHHRLVKYFISSLVLIETFILPLFEYPQTIVCPLIFPTLFELFLMLILISYTLLQFSFVARSPFTYLSYLIRQKITARNILKNSQIIESDVILSPSSSSPSLIIPDNNNNDDDNDNSDNDNNDNNNDDNNNNDNNNDFNNSEEKKEKKIEIKEIKEILYRGNVMMKLMELLYILFQVVIIVEVICYLFLAVIFELQVKRYSRILRCYLVVYHFKSLRISFYNIIRMMPKILEILFIIFSLISIYSLISYFLFLDTLEGEMYMSSFLQTLLSYYTLMTTINFPDVMMPTYSTTPWSSLIFISFLIFVFYFLLNLVLALIVKVYSQLMRDQMNKLYLFERQRLSFAFVLLTPSPSQGIEFKTWKRFIGVFRPRYSYSKTAFLFRLMNKSNSGFITASEFSELLSILQMEIFTSKKRDNYFDRLFPSFFQSSFGSFIKSVGASKVFELFMLGVVVVDVVLIVYTFIQSRSCDVGASMPELVIVIFFIVEFFITLITLGPFLYFTSFWHLMEFTILLVSIADIILSFALISDCSNLFLKLLFFAPTWRSFRFLKLSGYFNKISTTISLILPSLLAYCAMQILMYYPWVIAGMEVWEGKIYPGNPILEGTPFAASNYYANNFNNFLYAYVTCFELMVVNNWTQIASGYVAISGPTAWLFFITFNLWVVIIIVSWVIACIIESFQIHYEMQIARVQNEIENYVNEFNQKWSHKLDYVWEAKYKKRFRSALQQLYGSKEAVEYVEKTLGDPETSAQIARENLHLLL